MTAQQERPTTATATFEDLPFLVDNVILTTVGLDIGSATTHILISRIHLQRPHEVHSSSFEVIERATLYQSPVHFTPYLDAELIDAAAIGELVSAGYEAAGVGPDDIDAGAVLLTGVALERENARAVADLFAHTSGRFVCASAGHTLEAVLAAHGSGAVARSRDEQSTVLNIDVGGGTTKFALVRNGEVSATLAIAGGGRLIAWDTHRRITRLEPSLLDIMRDAHVDAQVGNVLTVADRDRLVSAIAARVAAVVAGDRRRPAALAGDLVGPVRPDRILLSGGVAQHLHDIGNGEAGNFDDLGRELAVAIRGELEALGIPLEVADAPIRATVVGASQFTVQVSGSTIFISDEHLLPRFNTPVVRAALPDGYTPPERLTAVIEQAIQRFGAHETAEAVAYALEWRGDPSHRNLQSIARAVTAANATWFGRKGPVLIAVEADVAATLGAIIAEEFPAELGCLVVDGFRLSEFDYIDLGSAIKPSNVVPVVVKSLIFPSSRTAP